MEKMDNTPSKKRVIAYDDSDDEPEKEKKKVDSLAKLALWSLKKAHDLLADINKEGPFYEVIMSWPSGMDSSIESEVVAILTMPFDESTAFVDEITAELNKDKSMSPNTHVKMIRTQKLGLEDLEFIAKPLPSAEAIYKKWKTN